MFVEGSFQALFSLMGTSDLDHHGILTSTLAKLVKMLQDLSLGLLRDLLSGKMIVKWRI
jgi:hypothetical protein